MLNLAKHDAVLSEVSEQHSIICMEMLLLIVTRLQMTLWPVVHNCVMIV